MSHIAPDFRKLLPCPFCGGAPEFHMARSGSSEYPYAWQIRCDRCQIKVPSLGKTNADAIARCVEDWEERSTSRRRYTVPIPTGMEGDDE